MPDVVELMVPNAAEYFLRDPSLQLTGEERARVVRFSGTYECEHAVFWSDQPRVLVLPAGLNQQWYEDIHRVLGLEAPPVVAPARRTGLLVADLLLDADAQIALRRQLSGYDLVHVQLVGPTPEIYQLAAMIRGWGQAVELECVSAENYWTSLYLDSKTSVLDLARQLPDLRVANGLVVHNWMELRGGLAAMVARHGKVIARTAFGVAGDGSSVVSSEPGSVDRFLDDASRDSFFAFPILIQQFVEHAPGVGCPAVDIMVGDHDVEDLVLCALTVENGYQFRSVDVGDGALSAPWAERVLELGRLVGNAARELGYRGWMCVDCVAGADDQLYVTEINARRGGSLHAGSLLRTWRAERELTVTAHFMLHVSPGLTYAEHIRPVFERLWEDGVRAYPTSARALDWDEPLLAVMAAAPTAAESQRIVAQIADAVAAAGGSSPADLAGAALAGKA